MAVRGTDVKLGGDAAAMAKIYARLRAGGGAGVDEPEYPCEVGEEVS